MRRARKVLRERLDSISDGGGGSRRAAAAFVCGRIQRGVRFWESFYRMNDDRYDNDLFAGLPQGEDLRDYIERGRPTNHFLTALLENDLMACLGRADARNRLALSDYCMWLKSYAPGQSYSSRENVAAWIAHKGLSGSD